MEELYLRALHGLLAHFPRPEAQSSIAIVDQTLPRQSLIKTMLTDVPRGQSDGGISSTQIPSPSRSLVCAMLINYPHIFCCTGFFFFFSSFLSPLFLCFFLSLFFICSPSSCLRERKGDGKHEHEVVWGGLGRSWGQENNMKKYTI